MSKNSATLKTTKRKPKTSSRTIGGRGYAMIVANSPGPRKRSYEEMLEKYQQLKDAGKIKPAGIQAAPEQSSSIPMRGKFTAEEIIRAIESAKD